MDGTDLVGQLNVQVPEALGMPGEEGVPCFVQLIGRDLIIVTHLGIPPRSITR